MNISVVYPAFNEAGNIERTIARSLDALGGKFDQFELIIVDDGSTDATGAMAEQLARRHPEIVVLHNEHNQGLAPTLLRGLRRARFELVTYNGMDYPFDLADLPKMAALLDHADIVVASRMQHAGYTCYRKIISYTNRAMLRWLFNLPLRDFNFVQLFRKEVLDAVEVHSRSAGFVAPEIILRAHSQGFRIVSVDIAYYPRLAGEPSCGRPSVVLGSLWELLSFYWNRRKFAPPTGVAGGPS
ncbi:MAG TPA: glycosyltransferase [Phycisphaerae bacterium]|nr:glycosyltransferase [Phycisphaerae bacterium]HRY66531.1 glycosyltransferase [Phycisphaerae bacterium]HSA28643.1 glycosyltransferase [Phycisphaerae bacterium]